MVIKVRKAQLTKRAGRVKALGEQRNKIFQIANERTRKLINGKFINTTNLANFRKRQVDAIGRINDEYVRNTQNVLNKQTLDFLVAHSNIDVPTLTSIFAGYELARASRAERLEKKRGFDIQQLQLETKQEENRIKQQDERFKIQNELNKEQRDRELDVLDDLGDSINKDVTDENKASLADTKALNNAEIKQTQFNVSTTNNERSANARIEVANIRKETTEKKKTKNLSDEDFEIEESKNKTGLDGSREEITLPPIIPDSTEDEDEDEDDDLLARLSEDDVLLNDLPATVSVLDDNLNPPVIDIGTGEEVLAQVTYINTETNEQITLSANEEVPDGYILQTEVLT